MVYDGEVASDLIDNLGKAMYLAQIVAYAQGFQQLTMAAKAYDWELNYPAIAQNWEAGCIIHAKTLYHIEDAYADGKQLDNLFQDPYFAGVMEKNLPALRAVVKLAAEAGVPTPSFSAALNYLESIFNPSLPANMIQAQRDYFGAHTYYRNDREGVYHTEWYEEK